MSTWTFAVVHRQAFQKKSSSAQTANLVTERKAHVGNLSIELELPVGRHSDHSVLNFISPDQCRCRKMRHKSACAQTKHVCMLVAKRNKSGMDHGKQNKTSAS